MSAMDKVNNILGKLPFVKLAGKIPSGIIGKIPVLKTVIPFANHAAVVLLIVVLAACFGGGGGSSGGSGETSAQTVNGGEPYVIPDSDFTYEMSSDGTGVKIEGYTGPGGNIIFPTEIEGLPIVEIPDPRYGAMCINNVTSVVFPDYYLQFFESLNPSFVETMEWLHINSLFDLGAGDEIILADRGIFSPIDINYIATMFDYWQQGEDNPLVNVVFPKGISYIPNSFFSNTRQLKSYAIPDTVTVIGGGAFSGSGLTSIVIPEEVTVIQSSAFAGCKDLKSVTLPESLKAMSSSIFLDCPNLETVNLPSHKITYRGGQAFYNCKKLNLATQKAIRDSGYTGSF